MDAEEWRVEVDLDDDEHGYSFTERLRALRLDDEARKRLGRSIVVSRNGPRLFLYAQDEPKAREAERVVRELLAAHDLTATVGVTRWHPVEQEWEEASVPLPRSEEDRAAEYARREAAEAAEAEREGMYEWTVRISCPDRAEAEELVERLTAEGLPVERHFRYVGVGALTRERAEELAARFREELPPDRAVEVEANVTELREPIFRILEQGF